MANISSSKKDIRRNAKRRARNQATKSALKTYIKKTRLVSINKDAAETQKALQLAVKALDKAVQRGIIHKNQAARRKSRLMTNLNKLVSA